MMSPSSEHAFAPLEPHGAWEKAFSYHPFNVEIAKAEGAFIYDTEGRRYYDASGGPFAVNLGHGHPKMKAAIIAQLEDYAFAHPTLANRRRAAVRRRKAAQADG